MSNAEFIAHTNVDPVLKIPIYWQELEQEGWEARRTSWVARGASLTGTIRFIRERVVGVLAGAKTG